CSRHVAHGGWRSRSVRLGSASRWSSDDPILPVCIRIARADCRDALSFCCSVRYASRCHLWKRASDFVHSIHRHHLLQPDALHRIELMAVLDPPRFATLAFTTTTSDPGA